MSKLHRELSGIYFRYLHDGITENVCFEDLPLEEQNMILNERTEDWYKGMILQLSDTINRLGDAFDMYLSDKE